MNRRASDISVFNYTDYRRYLDDFYHERKRVSRAFSYRFFAKRAGINSVGLYKDVVEGRQRLGRALIFKFSNAIGHTKKEAEYFANMVFFNEADTVEERTLYFDRMVACQKTKARLVETTKYEYYQKWYYSAIRALVSIGRFRDCPADHRTLAKTLNPRIRPDEAKKALNALERLGFIARDSSGVFHVADAVLTTGTLKPEASIASLNVLNFQKEMNALSHESLDRFGAGSINLSTLTLGISASTVEAVKEELAAVRNKIAALAEKDNMADRVYQLNMQFFPMSDIYRERADA
jgi:uncharacterized protein (TIGR02147 family)